MIKLYYAPGACSLAPHIVLEEVGDRYELARVDFAANQQNSADYLRVNPKARVPALTDGDWVLTEAPAILRYIAARHPAVGLWPWDPREEARCSEWLNWLTSTIHVAFVHVRRAARYASIHWSRCDTNKLSIGCRQIQEIAPMKLLPILFLLAALILAVAARPQRPNGTTAPNAPQAQQSQPPPTLASAVDREISAIEKQIVDAAEAMPEDKFNFSPESLNIAGSDYKGVRTFAVQVKHVAASNYFIWSPLTGDKLPEGLKDGNGPENLKSKADIIRFLKDSFALGHKAAATLTTENMLQAPEHGKSNRLRLATFGVAHGYDHYGQMVEYLRMNGIVPPASRGKSD